MKIMNTIEEFRQVVESESLVLAQVSDLGCNVCLAITPDLDDMSTRYPKATFISVDTKVIPEMASEHLVFVYPTLIVFAEGKETKRFERVFSLLDVEEHIDRMASILFED